MAARLPDGLLEDVKNYLGITWNDEATDHKIRGLIGLGITYLNRKIGVPADYTQEDYPRMLLFDYVRYARDGALDVFEANYLSMILAAQNSRKVDDYAAQNALSCDQ